MAVVFTQTDAGDVCGSRLVFCSGIAGAHIGDVNGLPAVIGAAAGAGTFTFSSLNSADTRACGIFTLTIPVGMVGGAGTWTVRLNLTTGNMNLDLTSVSICRLNSSCLNEETIGSATGLAVDLNSTGVISQDVDGGAVTFGAGDFVVIVLGIESGSMSAQTCVFTADQNIDSPFTEAAATSLLYDPHRAMRPHLVRKVRDFFIGGLPPKLAKLRMKLTDAGLWLPANDPAFRRRAA